MGKSLVNQLGDYLQMGFAAGLSAEAIVKLACLSKKCTESRQKSPFCPSQSKTKPYNSKNAFSVAGLSKTKRIRRKQSLLRGSGGY
jgi:hypothetical protein